MTAKQQIIMFLKKYCTCIQAIIILKYRGLTFAEIARVLNRPQPWIEEIFNEKIEEIKEFCPCEYKKKNHVLKFDTSKFKIQEIKKLCQQKRKSLNRRSASDSCKRHSLQRKAGLCLKMQNTRKASSTK